MSHFTHNLQYFFFELLKCCKYTLNEWIIIKYIVEHFKQTMHVYILLSTHVHHHHDRHVGYSSSTCVLKIGKLLGSFCGAYLPSLISFFYLTSPDTVVLLIKNLPLYVYSFSCLKRNEYVKPKLACEQFRALLCFILENFTSFSKRSALKKLFSY